MFNHYKILILALAIILITLLSFASLSQEIPNNRIWQEKTSSEKILYDYRNFSAFFYDLDNDIGTESIEIDVSNYHDRTINKGDLFYTTQPKEVRFKFCEWGNYLAIGYFGDIYLAGYSYDSNITNQDINLLREGFLGKIVKEEEDVNYKISEQFPLIIGENYKIKISDIDESQKSMLLYILKNEIIVYKRLISFDDARGNTCIFSRNIKNMDVPFIILHLKTPFEGFESRSITVDAIFQISEKPIFLKDVPKMNLIYSNNMIILKNNENIRLDKDSIIPIFDNIALRVADSDDLRFMLIKSRSSNYRSAPIYANEMDSYTLTPFNFEGFYYDIDKSLGTEQLCLTFSEYGICPNTEGIIYTTTAQRKRFNFTDWGYFNIIGFLGKEYFASYAFDENITPENQILYNLSLDENSLAGGQLQRILIDDDREITISSVVPLEEGYELRIRSIDKKENKAFVELYKDGHLEDTKVISPSIRNANMSEKTYYYRKTIGNQKDLVIISIHFIKAFRGTDSNQAIIDGIWQISEDATDVTTDTKYGKMKVASVTDDEIIMDNKDNTIKLDKDKNIDLMGGISIETADAEELRFIITKEKSSN